MRERRRAFIRKYQIRMGVVACLVCPSVFTYLEPDPTPDATLRSWCFRFLVGVVAFIQLSYYFLGRAWDKHYGIKPR
jgi:hypothetical protein